MLMPDHQFQDVMVLLYDISSIHPDTTGLQVILGMSAKINIEIVYPVNGCPMSVTNYL